MNRKNNAFRGGPPSGYSSSRETAEDAICRALLRYKRINVYPIITAANKNSRSRLTIDDLMDHANLPCRIAITGCNPDSAQSLISKFNKTDLYASWVAMECPPLMAFRGGEWGMGIMSMIENPIYNCVWTQDTEGNTFAVEHLSSWLSRLDWNCSLLDTTD